MRVFLFVICFLVPVCANADSIQLPGTGQAQPGASGIGQRDANYTVQYQSQATAANGVSGVVQSPSSPAYIAYIIDPKWRQDAPWITPTANGMADLSGGIYIYRASFDLPAGTTSITGSLYVDDRVSVWFNGKLITELPTDAGSGYWANTLSTFAITSGFLLGANTIEFRVLNTNPSTPVGLAVTNLTANTAAVPEPASLVLLGSGLAGMAAMLRKRRRQ